MGQLKLPNDRMSILCRSLYAYWNTIRGDRPMPTRNDFEPLDVPRLLPYVFLLDVQARPLDFHYRIVGEHIARFSSQNLMGQWASQLDRHRDPSPVWALLRHTVRDRAPRMIHFSYRGDDISVSRLPVLSLPLSDDGGAVNKIVGLVDYAECIERRGIQRKPAPPAGPAFGIRIQEADGRDTKGREAGGDDGRKADHTFYNAL